MANRSTCSNLEEAMDEIWFHKNILFFQPVNLNTLYMLQKNGSMFGSTSSSEDSSSSEVNIKCSKLFCIKAPPQLLQSAANENKNKQIVKKMKKPERLNIAIQEIPYQLQKSSRSKTRSCCSSPSKDKCPPPLPRMPWRGYWSLTELENYEHEGFNDLACTLDKEKLSPHMMSMVPGLRRFGGGHKGFEESKVEQVRRPYLSEGWLINRSDSPLLNLRMLPKFIDGSDMKRYLRFWAQRVASSVFHEL